VQRSHAFLNLTRRDGTFVTVDPTLPRSETPHGSRIESTALTRADAAFRMQFPGGSWVHSHRSFDAEPPHPTFLDRGHFMKTFAIALLVALSASAAMAGDFAVSPATLDSMGLSTMKPLSDDAGLAVRGKGPLEDLFGGTIPGFLGSALHEVGDITVSGFSGLSQVDVFLGGADFFSGITFTNNNFNFGNFPFVP
jgi:hypothetical protein